MTELNVPEGYELLPPGVRCRCLKQWQAAPGRMACCRGRGNRVQPDLVTATTPARPDPWPLGGYAPGNYFCVCTSCQLSFQGDKRATTCLSCAVLAAKEVLQGAPRQVVELSEDDLAAITAAMDKHIGGRVVPLGATRSAQAIADQVVLEVAELPDRTSPVEWPEAMLVTADELRAIVTAALGES